MCQPEAQKEEFPKHPLRETFCTFRLVTGAMTAFARVLVLFETSQSLKFGADLLKWRAIAC